MLNGSRASCRTPHILDLAVQLVNFFGWMSQGGHPEPLLLLAFFTDKLLLEHVGLPQVLDIADHLVNFFGWMSEGGHSEPLLLLALFYQSTPSCLKVMGGWLVWVVAHVILVSTLGPNPSFFSFLGGILFNLGICWDRGVTIQRNLLGQLHNYMEIRHSYSLSWHILCCHAHTSQSKCLSVYEYV